MAFSNYFTYLREIDQLKQIERQALIMNGKRNENSAEHSWHLAMAVIGFSEYNDNKSDQKIDVLRALKMALIHDIGEIDAGDVFVYHEHENNEDKLGKELKCLERILGALPKEKSKELFVLWHEYNDRETNEAKLVYALDRILPMLCNLETGGHSWKKHDIKIEQVINKINEWEVFFPELSEYFISMLKSKESECF